MPPSQTDSSRARDLQLTAVDDLGLDSGADGTGGGTESLDLLDDGHGLSVSNLAENDVLTIEPRGHNGGDEELRAVAVEREKSGTRFFREAGSGSERRQCRLTCWGRRWPWRADRGGRA